MQVRRKAVLLLAAMSAAVLVAADDNPFVGKWKLDPSKSELTGETFTLTDAGDGAVKYSGGGESFTFTTDGKPSPGLYGRIVIVKVVNPNTWDRTTRFRGKTLAQTNQTLSDDGKTLTMVTKGTKPNGEAYESTEVYERRGDGSGMMGTWKSTEVKNPASGLMEFSAYGSDGLTLNIVDYKATCNAKLDGKDYPATGPTVPAGLTLALTKSGDRSFDMVEKVKGKPVNKSTWTVSDDGKTLTSTGSPVGVNEPTKAVYDKQ